MTAHVKVSLHCNECSRGYPEEFDTITEVREDAKENGWDYVKVENGSYWDFCATCLRQGRYKR